MLSNKKDSYSCNCTWNNTYIGCHWIQFCTVFYAYLTTCHRLSVSNVPIRTWSQHGMVICIMFYGFKHEWQPAIGINLSSIIFTLPTVSNIDLLLVYAGNPRKMEKQSSGQITIRVLCSIYFRGRGRRWWDHRRWFACFFRCFSICNMTV